MLPENHAERDRLVDDLARQLGVEGEVDLTKITNVSAEGTDIAARFPVSQQTLNAVAGGPKLAALFIAPEPN
jgi:hypothetical protein